MRFRKKTREDIGTLFQLLKETNRKLDALGRKFLEYENRAPEPTLFPVESCSSFPKKETSKTPEKPAEWVGGAEATKLLGWKTCSSEKLEKARITFRQTAKNKPLSVNVRSIDDYIKRRRPRKRRNETS